MFEQLKIPSEVQVNQVNNILCVTKWNWVYSECLEFQEQAQSFIQKNKNLKIYIFCNHPHLFTLGRGNERGNDELKDFEPSEHTPLSFPLHKIHRGGGITFHYPGQWIFYPIVSINSNYTLDDHMCWLLKSVKENLEATFNIEGLLTAKKLMGIWKDKKKVASIGVGMKRFVTEHGLALNLNFDEKMFTELKKINPCGMDSLTYKCIDEFTACGDLLNTFHNSYMKNIQ